MKKNIPLILISFLLFVGSLAGYLIYNVQNPNFYKLDKDEMYQRIINERDYAINKAVKNGDYRCCIDPPCTMCYMEANEWNYFQAGTCACDDLIVQGKEPCPQCKKGLCKENGGSCSLKEN